jgi:hypothetical protein
MPREIDQVVGGTGPMPGGLTPASPETSGMVDPKMLLIAWMTIKAAAGSAMSTPTVPTRRAAIGALASRRNSTRSRRTPSAGATIKMAMIAAGRTGSPSPSGECSWK